MSNKTKSGKQVTNQDSYPFHLVDRSFFYDICAIMSSIFSICSVSVYSGNKLTEIYKSENVVDNANNFTLIQFYKIPDFADLKIYSSFHFVIDNEKQILWQKIVSSILKQIIEIDSQTFTDLMLQPCPSLHFNHELLTRYALSNATVFISGPSGSGKTFLARYLHTLSRNMLPCIELNLASIPHDLLELELFGHTPGAFTDAILARDGKLKLAGEGTLILDGIESLSLTMQTKLASVLQHQNFYPIGSSTQETFRARLIVQSKDSCQNLLKSKSIREELYYLINVLPINLLSLSQRPDDIVFFIDLFQQRSSPLPCLNEDAMKQLLSQNWRGNIHELLNTLELARVRGSLSIVENNQYKLDRHSLQKDLKESVNQFKKKLIHDILIECNGNQTYAAKILGIQRTYLSRLMKDLSIPL